jgi:hypothetical protein
MPIVGDLGVVLDEDVDLCRTGVDLPGQLNQLRQVLLDALFPREREDLGGDGRMGADETVGVLMVNDPSWATRLPYHRHGPGARWRVPSRPAAILG